MKISKEVFNEVNKFDSLAQFLRSGGLSNTLLDRMAFGFAEEDIKTLMPNQLHIKWKQDWQNVKEEQERSGLSKIKWAGTINLFEPIDVSFRNGKFWVEDGHHRTFAAKILNKPLNVKLEIRENPTVALGYGYDEFCKELFTQVKSMNSSETIVEKILREGYGKTDKEEVMQAIDEIRSMGYPNPFDPRTVVIQDKVGLEISFFDGALWVSSIQSYEPGGGRLGMQIVLEMADKHHVIVRLSAEPFGGKTLNKSQLIAWYKRLGFKKASQGYERLPK